MGSAGSKTTTEAVVVAPATTVKEKVSGTVTAVTLRIFLEALGMSSLDVTRLEEWSNQLEAMGTFQQHLEQAKEVVGAVRLTKVVEGKSLAKMLDTDRYDNPLFQITVATPLVVMVAAMLSAVRVGAVLVQGYLGPDSWHRALIAGPASPVGTVALVDIAAIIECTAAPAVLRRYDADSPDVISRLEFFVRLASTVTRNVQNASRTAEVEDVPEDEGETIRGMCAEYFSTME